MLKSTQNDQCPTTDHLSDSKVYKRLSKREAIAHTKGVARIIEEFIDNHKDALSDPEYLYLKRGLKRDKGKIARFYTTVKVHKKVEKPLPHPFRPITASCGTAQAILSKWLDQKLQQLTPFILTWIKDSNQFLNYVNAFVKLQKNGRLPPNARMITADAVSMYTNIETTHALNVLRWFLEELKEEGQLPEDFDIDMIIEAAAIIMRWNIMEVGDTFLKQLN